MSWLQLRLSQLLTTSDSGVWGDEDMENGISVLRSTNMSNDGAIDFKNVTLRDVPATKRAEKLLRTGDIILENSGGGPKQPVGRVCYFAGDEREHVVGNFCRRLRPVAEVVNPRFLFWRLFYGHTVGDTLRYQTQTTGLRNLQFKSYAEQTIELPSPKEQSRIVELLDQADALRRLRREADAKAARILPALFLKMFGDPASNPMSWPEVPLSQVIESVVSGWSAPSEGGPANDDEFGVLKVSAVTSGKFRPEENKVVTDIDETRALVTPQRGDLLFSRANTRELVAASCIVEQDFPKLFLSDKLWKITPIVGKASTVFLKELFWQDGVRDKFRASSSGSSGSMLNISKDAMLRTQAPMPPFALQMQFEKVAWSVLATMESAVKASDGIETIWKNLLQRAFSGQLTAKWRQTHMAEILAEMQQQAKALNLPMPQGIN